MTKSKKEREEQVSYEISRFIEFLFFETHTSEKTRNRYRDNLILFANTIMGYTDTTMYTLTKANIKNFIELSLIESIITSKQQLNSMLTTLRKFVHYLGYEGIMEYQENKKLLTWLDDRDYFRKKYDTFKSMKFKDELTIEQWLNDEFLDKEKTKITNLDINKNIHNIIKDQISNNPLIEDYDKYINYIENNNIKATETNKHISRTHLKELNSIMRNIRDNGKTQNQIDNPYLQLFYQFSIDNNIITIKEEYIIESKNFNNYKQLSFSEKYTLFIDHIWNKLNWADLLKKPPIIIKFEQENRKAYAEMLSNLAIDKWYEFDKLKINYEPKGKIKDPLDIIYSLGKVGAMDLSIAFNSRIIRYFDFLGLVDVKYNSGNRYDKTGKDIKIIKLTKLGYKVLSILSGKTHKKEPQTKVISLF
ncbi:site-specific integrase [Dethiothermospora halolimnae]|uniref:site-specific integrase n=1 Tax=Dethiothermospora halolimnae TaxID=3114390 RepID=UPI003CCB9146